MVVGAVGVSACESVMPSRTSRMPQTLACVSSMESTAKRLLAHAAFPESGKASPTMMDEASERRTWHAPADSLVAGVQYNWWLRTQQRRRRVTLGAFYSWRRVA